MASLRRIGAPDAKNRTVLLDAAERLLVDEGLTAVTSRRVADRAGLKPQLVHYYFRTMDDLYLAMFRRSAQGRLVLLGAALESAQPLWELWRLGNDLEAARLTLEFLCLAHHREELRAEISRYTEIVREQQTTAIGQALRRHGIDDTAVPAIVWAVIGGGASHLLNVERVVGIDAGHAEASAFCEQWLRRLEGDPLPPPIDDAGRG